MKTEIRRQIIHASGILLVPIIAFLGKDSLYVIGLFFMIFLASSLFRTYRKQIRKFLVKIKILDISEKLIEKQIRKYEREKEFPHIAPMTFLFGSFITVLFFEIPIAIAAITILAMGDSLSTLVGKYYGKYKIMKNTSLEGSAAFFISSLGILYYLGFRNFVLIAFLSTFNELIPGIDDNISIPILVGPLLTFI